MTGAFLKQERITNKMLAYFKKLLGPKYENEEHEKLCNEITKVSNVWYQKINQAGHGMVVFKAEAKFIGDDGQMHVDGGNLVYWFDGKFSHGHKCVSFGNSPQFYPEFRLDNALRLACVLKDIDTDIDCWIKRKEEEEACKKKYVETQLPEVLDDISRILKQKGKENNE